MLAPTGEKNIIRYEIFMVEKYTAELSLMIITVLLTREVIGRISRSR